MPIVKVPDGRLVRFPDEMANEQIKDIIRSKFPGAYASEDRAEAPLLQLSDEQKSVIAARKKAYEDKQSSHWTQNPLVRAAAAFGQGISNASLNPAGYDARKIGIDTKPLQAENATERALEKAGEYGFDAAVMALGGNKLKAAGLLGKGQGLASKAAQAVLAPGKGAVTAAASGGALEGAADPESTAGKIAANVVGGMLGGVAANTINFTPAHFMKVPLIKPEFNKSYQTLKGGLENVVKNNDALRLVRRGATIDDDIARTVTRDATEAAGNINQESVEALDKVLNGVDARTRYKDVRKSYQEFVDKNKSKKIKNWDKMKDLNPFQEKAYQKALKEGLDRADPGAVPGQLGHLLSARKRIDTAINKSYIQEFPGKKATDDTALLVELRKRLDHFLAQNPEIKGHDRIFELYQQFDDMYKRGLQYKPGAVKNIMNKTLLEAGGDAEKAMQARIGLRKGLFDNITANVTPAQNFSQTAKNYQNVLKEVNYEPDYKDLIDTLSKNENAYSRLVGLKNRAENKLVTPEVTRLFLREQGESKGSSIGAALDYILGRLSSGYYKDAANRLLNASGDNVDVLTRPLYEQIIGNILTGSVKGGGNNVRTMLAQDIARELLRESDGQDKKHK